MRVHLPQVNIPRYTSTNNVSAFTVSSERLDRFRWKALNFCLRLYSQKYRYKKYNDKRNMYLIWLFIEANSQTEGQHNKDSRGARVPWTRTSRGWSRRRRRVHGAERKRGSVGQRRRGREVERRKVCNGVAPPPSVAPSSQCRRRPKTKPPLPPLIGSGDRERRRALRVLCSQERNRSANRY